MTTKTKALLDYGEVAFRDVDAKLAVLLGGDSLPVGTAVELTGLSNDAFNGRRGIVTETPPEVRQAGRVAVIVDGQAIALKRENFFSARDCCTHKYRTSRCLTFPDPIRWQIPLPAFESHPIRSRIFAKPNSLNKFKIWSPLAAVDPRA